ncbi:MAG: DUF4831 family protein [Bacteroidales bacterium]|nr:DUF4831 family protein [Bacteroidales bacterium]
MRRSYIIIPSLMMFVMACTVPGRFLVTDLGFEPEGTEESCVYTLPRTTLKVTVQYQHELFIPGPYADYAQRLLGIEDVQKNREESFTVKDVVISRFVEPDLEKVFSLNMIQGEVNDDFLHWADNNDLIIRENYNSEIPIKVYSSGKGSTGILYKDVTMESNMEMKKETIYKTIITDTSFVRVPVTTEQMEMKTIGKKAEEAAKLILEIRSDKYYVAAGLIDPFPDNFDMKTSLEGLDQLEEAYLSLFIGKSFAESFVKEYLVSPEGLSESESYELDMFNFQKGITEDEGEPLMLEIVPQGNATSYRNLLPQEPEEDSYNRFYFRIPEVCNVSVYLSEQVLCKKRMTIFQAGPLVNQKVKVTEVSRRDAKIK